MDYSMSKIQKVESCMEYQGKNMPKQESFLTDIIALNRVTIKKEVMEQLNLKEGDRVRITVEKV